MAFEFLDNSNNAGVVRVGNASEIQNIWGPPPQLLEFTVEEGQGTGGSTQTVTASLGPFSGKDCCIVASCSASDDGTNTTVAATWKGGAMTVGRSDAFSLQQRTVIFVLPIGDVDAESGDVVFTVSLTSGDCSRRVVAYAYANVDQGSPVSGTDGGNASSTSFGSETSPTIASSVVFAVVMNIHNATSMTLSQINQAGAEIQTQGSTSILNGDRHSFGVCTFTPALTTSQNCRWDWSGSTQAAMSMITLRSAPGGGGTLMGWINPTTFGGDGFGYIISKDDVNSFVGGWVFQVDNNDPTGSSALRLFHRFLGGSSPVFQSAIGSISLGVWQHVAVSWNKNSGDLAVFTINGVVSPTTLLSSPTPPSGNDSPDEMWIGNVGDYSKQYHGFMADLRIYKRIVPLKEIQAVHAAFGQDTVLLGMVRRFPMSPERAGLGPSTPYVYVTNQSNGATSTLTVNVPTTHVEGDLLIAVIGDGANGSNNAPVISASAAGWEDQVQFPTAAAVSRSSCAVFTRIATASEPVDYSFTSDQGSTPKIGYIFAFRGISNRTANATPVVSQGTSITPIAPAITPGNSSSFILRIWIHDDSSKIPTPRGDGYPPETVGWRIQGITGSGSNGVVLCVSGENFDDSLAPTRLHTAKSSDEWGTCSISWTVDYSTGIEGLACKDLSNFKGHATVQERGVLGGPDPLKIGGC